MYYFLEKRISRNAFGIPSHLEARRFLSTPDQLLYWEEILRPTWPHYCNVKRLFASKSNTKRFKKRKSAPIWLTEIPSTHLNVKRPSGDHGKITDSKADPSNTTSTRYTRNPNKCLILCVASFSKKHNVLHKHMCIVLGIGLQECMEEPRRNDGLNQRV